MKKIYTTLCALVMGAMAVNAAGVEITFGGSEMPAHWTVSGSPTSVAVADGHLQVVMAESTKYRADLKYEDGSKADMVLDPQKDKVMAVKFIGTRPSGSLKFEFNNGTTWYNTKWNGGNPANITTKGDNHIYYFDLTADANYKDATELQSVWKMNFVIADGTVQREYTIDWIKTFESVDEMKAAESWADDGENDKDEPANAPSPVYNETTGDEYNSFGDAFTAISGTDGHVLTLNTNQTTTERHIFNGDRKNVTIQGAEGQTVTLYRGSFNKTQTMFESNNSTKTTLRNLTLSGANAGAAVNQSIVAANSSGSWVIENVKIVDFTTSETYSVVNVKAYTNITMSGVTFENNNSRSDVYVNANGTLVWGDNNIITSIELVKNGHIRMASATPATVALFAETIPTRLTLQADNDNDFAEGDVVVENCTDPSMFVLTNEDLTLEAKDGNLVLAKEQSTGVELPEADAADAVVNVYNMQGVQVRANVKASEATMDLAPGFYIVGNKKVYVK